jgi:hypothetical protein
VKVCTKCKIEKELIFFNKNESKKSGYHSQCKNCTRETRLALKASDPKEYALSQKANREKYKKTISLACKRYAKNNPEKIAAIKKRYAEKKKQEKILRTRNLYYFK